jgi:L-alanine-DL-glutamate epimerase-like enolase superfamily enzyme
MKAGRQKKKPCGTSSGWRRIRHRIYRATHASRWPLPLFGDESYHYASNAARCAECYHGVNVKLLKTGGISAAQMVSKVLSKFNLPLYSVAASHKTAT